MDPDNVRPIQEGTADPLLEAERIAVATKEALKRKIAQAAAKDFQSWTVPQKLQIDPNDPEDVVCLELQFILLGLWSCYVSVIVAHELRSFHQLFPCQLICYPYNE